MLTQASRPFANFHPSLWGDSFLSSTSHVEKVHEIKELKLKVKKEISAIANKPLEQVNLIDALERLGVAYHFEDEIEAAIQQMYETIHDDKVQLDDLYHTSISFRILRQHGFHVSCDVFSKFMDRKGNFKNSIVKDVPGMLSLYEASHVRVHSDEILNKALTFSTSHLKHMVDQSGTPLAEQVAHALHQPLHRGMPQVESRHYISVYEQNPSHDKSLLRLAKLNFNMLQSMHQEELKDLMRWWKGLHLNATFSRDRMPEA